MFEIQSIKFIRRSLFFGALQFVLLSVLLGRMYYLQVIEGSHYKLLAEGNRIALKPTLPLRGQIYDRQGIPIVVNEANFRVVLLADKKLKVKAILERLSQLIKLSPEDCKKIIDKAKKIRGIESQIIKENLTWDEVSIIEMHLDQLEGISVETGCSRKYPFLKAGAHLVGYVATASQEEQEKANIPGIPGLVIGKVGVEKYFDEILRGAPGYTQVEVDASRKLVRELKREPSIPGKDVHLTIDIGLQSYIQERLQQHESASAIVMDVTNGEVLAFVSNPSFDPNLFPTGVSLKDWNTLIKDPYTPLTNKAISGLYPPGSAIKALVALAALDEGIINEDTKIYCPGFMYLGEHKFHCWHKTGHGYMNVEQAIIQSCDVFFYEIAKLVGIKRLAKIFRKFGMGAQTLEKFPHEKSGLVPDKKWKQKKKNSSWTVGDTIQTSIGQGYFLATPIQLAVVASRLASNGRNVSPVFVKNDLPPNFSSLAISEKSLRIINKAMNLAINDPRGTGYRWRIFQKGQEMAGKTGSSQVRRITLKQRRLGETKTHHLPWKYREHGLFIGYAPAHNPRFAISVVIEHSGGAADATHAARDILKMTQQIFTEGK